MHRIDWSDEFSVGNAKIDEQHEQIVRIANALIKAVELGRDHRVLGNVFRRLREYTVFHFQTEEQLMDTVDYPGRSGHLSDHIRLKNEVMAFQRRIYEQEDVTPPILLDFVRHWLFEHTLTYDRDLARYITKDKICTGTCASPKKPNNNS